MATTSPVQALGHHVQHVRPVLVDIVCSRHDQFAEAHQASGSRYSMGFGTQWRDLLDDVEEALWGRGYRTYKLPPAGYRLPVVNDCLLYVWRVKDSAGAVASFASSPTRVNGFNAPPLDPTLFEPGFANEPESATDGEEKSELEQVVRAVDGVMPLVLVIVQSSPRQLQSIDWAVAKLDEYTGKVDLHGHETLWEPEGSAEGAEIDVESFDSGTPNGPAIEPQEQEGTELDA